MKQIITTTLTIAKPQRLALFLITLLLLPSVAWGARYTTTGNVTRDSQMGTGDKYFWTINSGSSWKWSVERSSSNVDINGESNKFSATFNYNAGTVTLTATNSISDSGILRKIYLDGLTTSGECTITVKLGDTSLASGSHGEYSLDTSSAWGSSTITITIQGSTNATCEISSISILTGSDDSGTNFVFNLSDCLNEYISSSGSGVLSVSYNKDAEASKTFTALLSPSEGRTIKYASTNPAIALVDEGTGVVTLTGTEGEAVISATPEDNDNYYGYGQNAGDSYTVTVQKAPTKYPITIAGIQVTDVNASAITGDNILLGTDGYVTFTLADADRYSDGYYYWPTLTLNNATINGSIEWSETAYPNLRIVVNGTCKVIKETEGGTPLPAIKYSGTGTPTVHISKNSTDATLLIASYKNKGTSNGSVFSGFNSTIGVDDGLHQTTLYPDDGENYQIRYTCYTTAKVYDLAVAGIQVHEISSDFQGYKDHILKGQLENSVYTRNTTVTFDGTQLTLNNAAIETTSSVNAIITGLDLSINLIGTNTITTASGYAFSRSSQESRTVSFTSSSSPAGTLTLSKSLDPQGLTSGITLDTTGGWTVTYSGSATNLENATQAIITKGALTGIEIAGTLITSEYLDGNGVISGVSGITSGTVKFTPADNTASPATPATLTLNDAVLTAPIIIGLSKITIDIQGTNSITTDETCIQKMENTTPLVTFKSTSAEGSLILTSTGTSTGVNNISNVTFSNELAVLLTVYGYDNYTSNTYYFTDGSTSVAKIVPSYGVQVESAQILQVYEGNANDILGDGTDTKEPTVSFDKTTNTLTLNNASGISTISTTLSSLNIELVGSNSLYRSFDGSIFDSSSGEAVTINLKSTGETKGILTIETESNSSAKFKGDNVTLTPVAPIVLLSGDLTTNSGTLEYGTLSAPTMSSETVDGVSTITLTSTADNSTIKYSIDYVDASQTDITDATYDSSSKPTVSKPATVTARVTLNEVESATTTGKYFGTNPSPFTLISGTDPIDFDLTPAIEESDGISITSISGIESNVTYDAATRKISSSTMGSFNGQVSMSSTEGKTVILNNNFTATFNVQIDISQAVITLDNTELIYNGQEQTVSVQKVMVGDDVVPQDYYEVSGNTGTEIGNYSLTVTAKTRDSQGNLIYNNYTGTATKEWKITNHPTASASELGFNTETQTFSTYYNPNEDFNLPDGYVGYIIKGIEGSKVLTVRISYIPKGVAVLVEKGSSNENPVEEIPSEQPLKGTFEPLDVTSITGGTVYVLYNGMFVKSTSGTIPEKRCYLLIDTNVAAGTRGFIIDHGEGSTALRSVAAEGTHGKSDAWYTLQGRRLSAKPTKSGLYLHNGKKVVIK